MPRQESKHLTDILIRLTRILHDHMKQRGTKPSLSIIQVHALVLIERQYPSMHDLAHHLAITPPSATSLVHSLVSAQLVRRLQDPKDKRTFRLELTPTGHELLTRRLDLIAEGLEHLTQALSPADLQTLIRLMEQLISSHA